MNRCLAEGRERYRSIIARSESGGRCAELRPILSAFCDGEASPEEAASLREHLRACAHCRAAMRDYRTAPGAAAALMPLPLAAPSLLERAQEALAGLQGRVAERLPGGNPDAAAQLATSGGASGLGVAGAAKLAAICVGAAGGAAACVGAGVVPSPLAAEQSRPMNPTIVRPAPQPTTPAEAEAEFVRPEDAKSQPRETQTRVVEPGQVSGTENGGVEYAPAPEEAAPAPEAPAPTPPPPPAAVEPSAGSAAGEFGP